MNMNTASTMEVATGNEPPLRSTLRAHKVCREHNRVVAGAALPDFYAPDVKAAKCALEFFTANIRNLNTRRAYARAASDVAAWCKKRSIAALDRVQPVHVASYIEELQTQMAAPSLKHHLAALRMLFDWLVIGQVTEANPASSVRGPKHRAKKGKTPVLAAEETRQLLNMIEPTSAVGLRDRALIALMVYAFARVGAVSLEFDNIARQCVILKSRFKLFS
jgi:site-specific recombinase XerD